jgi:hypothetical protein
MPFSKLETIPGLVALESQWQEELGDLYPAFNSLCLQPASWQKRSVPCPRGCGCDHEVVHRPDGSGTVGVCRCPTAGCPDIPLSPSDLTPLEVSWTKLGYAVCGAFGLARRQAWISDTTYQIGSWSTDAVPVILTIQWNSGGFRRVVAESAADLRRRFILLAPTSDFLDAHCKRRLENHGAAFFALNSHTLLTAHGTLQPIGVPGELFAQFTPQPKETDMDVAQRAFGMVARLDMDNGLKPPTLLTVFRHYCIEELSMGKIALKYGCSRQTVGRRVDLIRKRIGVHPDQLRRLSPHIAKLEETIKDPRAKRSKPGAHLDEQED